MITAADVVYHAAALRLLGMWQWWISYVLNFIFFAGIALLITNALVMRKAESEAVMPLSALLFLLFAFTTGYFIPIEVMPKAMANIATSMPTSYTLAFASVAALGGSAPPSLLAYPSAVAVAVFTLGLYLFKPYSRP